ncbi:DUF2892 domain-containing protein [Hymenobacter sp. 15J16-1T3B]|uniref:YgaP family membrane protein n=1 Tax=Hymenobacter sp. 15J16-1T3B TaxID=2886941 RepID=UPI001D12EC45|nr:DUF2892 domain-containing protein [Hymenobacter sp. 15J16-1T3B]MCC3159727.1 DUF2892 domain-containing protein [Hymenobacter sp. 15J16-1T3B]
MIQNVGSYDRVIRIVLAAVVAASLLTLGARSFSGPEMLAWLLLPLVLLITGVTGYCPLYGLLGISTHRPWQR